MPEIWKPLKNAARNAAPYVLAGGTLLNAACDRNTPVSKNVDISMTPTITGSIIPQPDRIPTAVPTQVARYPWERFEGVRSICEETADRPRTKVHAPEFNEQNKQWYEEHAQYVLDGLKSLSPRLRDSLHPATLGPLLAEEKNTQGESAWSILSDTSHESHDLALQYLAQEFEVDEKGKEFYCGTFIFDESPYNHGQPREGLFPRVYPTPLVDVQIETLEGSVITILQPVFHVSIPKNNLISLSNIKLVEPLMEEVFNRGIQQQRLQYDRRKDEFFETGFFDGKRVERRVTSRGLLVTVASK